MIRVSLLMVFFLWNCNLKNDQQPDRNIKAEVLSWKIIKNPFITTINADSLKTYIAVTERFPPVQIKKSTHQQSTFKRPHGIILVISFLIQTREDIIPGKYPIKSEEPTKNIGDGTGFGLSISHSIVKNHGGTIEVKSKVGKRTELKIVLPARIGS